MKHHNLGRLMVLGLWGGMSLVAQVNRAQNFSFETPDPGNPNLAASWSPFYGGYTRVALPVGGWDQNFAAELSNLPGSTPVLKGLLQRLILNQVIPKPVRVTFRLKGEGIQNLGSDQYGASFYCKVQYTDGTQNWCATTLKTKNVGTFGWTLVGTNTAQALPHGGKSIAWIDFGAVLGPVLGRALVDDVQIAEFDPATSGFHGAFTFMGDDAPKSHLNIVLPILSSYGWKATEAAVVNYLQSGDPNYMNLSDLYFVQGAGWEIASHGVTHTDLSTLSGAALEDEFYWSKKFFGDRGFSVKSFVLPKGGYDGEVMQSNQAGAYFSSLRKVESGWNPMGGFRYDMKVQNLYWNTPLSTVALWINEAKARKVWLVLLFHHVTDSCNASLYYCSTVETFSEIAKLVQTSGLAVVTYEQGLLLTKTK